MTTTEIETKVESQASKEEVKAETKGDEKVADAAATVTDAGAAPGSPTKKTETLKPAVTVHKKDFENDVVYLYQFVRAATVPSLSADCLKLENWLRMMKIQYENVDHKLRFKSKKGQLPFVELNGKEIDDADVIIKELGKYFDKELDSGLTEEQKTITHAFISMLNNHTQWIIRWWRYNHPQEFMEAAQLDIKRTLNSRFPNAILNFIFKFGFKKQLRDTLGLGSVRFTSDEVVELAKEDLKALSNLLGSKDYFFGKEPHLLDSAAFGLLAQFIQVPFGGLKEWMKTETPNLIGLFERIKTSYWPDYDEMCSTLDMNTHLPKKTPTETDQPKEEETKKKKEDKKKKEKKEKLKKIKDSKLEEAAKEVEALKDEVVKEVKEIVETVKQEVVAAPNGGEAPKPEVTATE